jgi:predicted permease
VGREKVTQWLSGFSGRFRHYRSDEDLDEELRIHLEMQQQNDVEAGVPAAEARRRARLALGSPRAVVERVRDQELLTMLEGCYRDFVLGLRALWRNPVFSLTAILTLGIGIGANTAIFSLLHGLLLRSLPVSQPGQLVRLNLIVAEYPQGVDVVPYRTIELLQAGQHSMSGISAWSSNASSIEGKDGVVRLCRVGLVGGNGFEVLGLKAHLGRLIQQSDDVRGGPAEGWPVVLSHGLWADQFGADVGIVGRSIRIFDTAATVIGVTPRDFHGLWPGHEMDAYLPLQFMNNLAGHDVFAEPNNPVFFNALGRLRPGVSLAEAAAEIAVREPELLRESLPPQYEQNRRFRGAALRVDSARVGLPSFFRSTYSTPIYLMQGLVAVVLLLCCVNVSGLMMAKIHERRREFAIRSAIGAARWRLARQYLAESFVIALAGAALGSAVAWYGTGALLPFFRHPNAGIGMSIKPDYTVFVATAVSALLTTLFFGIVPAWRTGGSDPGALLKSRTGSAYRQIAGRAFVPVQISLSLVLVATAILLSQSLSRLRGERVGFALDHVTIQTPPFHQLPQQGEAKLDLYQRMVDAIGRSADVRSAAVTWFTPMTGFQANSSFQAPPEGGGESEIVTTAYNDVGPGYFRTMEIEILAGREFARSERRRDVCVLNESAAGRLFPGRQALGGYVRTADSNRFPETETCQVVGLAQDAKFANLREPPPPTLYFPITEETLTRAGNLVFLINAPDKAQAIGAYRDALREIAPSVPLVLFATLREQMDAALGSQRAMTTLNNLFGLVALFLSAIGLYGLLSSAVAQRTSEIGVRVALGARPRDVLWMILSDALRMVGMGTLLGALGLYFAIQYVQSLLYGVSAFDPWTLAATAALLAIVALAASLAPALRAASVDPIRALRTE